MLWRLSTPQQGYLLITDIAGYISFLTRDELEHGSEFHLYHGQRPSRQTVIDWRPFDY
jgi:hypothetical protein